METPLRQSGDHIWREIYLSDTSRELQTDDPLELTRLPADLRSWVAEWTLMAWTRQEAVSLRQGDSQSGMGCSVPRNDSFVQVLCLLCFSYATGIFSSEEVVANTARNPLLRSIPTDVVPFPEELPRFRRRHRPVLERLLTRIFVRTVSFRFELPNDGLTAEWKRLLHDAAVARLDTARHMDQQ